MYGNCCQHNGNYTAQLYYLTGSLSHFSNETLISVSLNNYFLSNIATSFPSDRILYTIIVPSAFDRCLSTNKLNCDENILCDDSGPLFAS